MSNGQAIVLVNNVFYLHLMYLANTHPAKIAWLSDKNRYFLVVLGEINILNNYFCCLLAHIL